MPKTQMAKKKYTVIYTGYVGMGYVVSVAHVMGKTMQDAIKDYCNVWHVFNGHLELSPEWTNEK